MQQEPVVRGQVHEACGEDLWRWRINRHRSNSKAWYCVICHRRRASQNRRDRIQRAIEAYGSECKGCGETDREVLTFDHVNDDGAEHRRQLGSNNTNELVKWAKENGWPNSLQLLCANCQLRKFRRMW